ARAEFPEWFGRVIKIHHRPAVVTKIEFVIMFEDRVDLATGHGPEVFGAARARLAAKYFQRHGRAPIDAIARPDADHEDMVARARVLELALDDFARRWLLQRKRAAAESGHLAPVAKFHPWPFRC